MPADPPYVLGRRIVIQGATGSGKTTLADRLGDALGLDVLHLDNIRHATGWDSTPWDEMRDQVEVWVVAHAAGWVVDGNYSRVNEAILSAADTFISLDMPWRVSFFRLCKRTMAHAWTGEPLYYPDGPKESWRLIFMSGDSILLWSIRNHQRRKRSTAAAIARTAPGTRLHRLETKREVEALVAAAKLQGTSSRM